MYVQDSIVIRGAVTRDSGTGPWAAWKLCSCSEKQLIGDQYETAADAQRAVEAAVK
jgi:hypothetical protein